MNRHWIVAAGLVWAVAGCQSSQQTTSLPPSGPTPPPARVADKPSASAPAVDPHVAEVTRQANDQAKAIEQVSVTRITDAPPAAKNPKPVITPVPPPEPTKAPGIGAVENAIAAMPAAKPTPPAEAGFKPVPPIVGPDGKPFLPTITPPGGEAAPAVPAVSANAPTPDVSPVPDAVLLPPAKPAGNAGDPLGQQLAKRAREYPRDLAPQVDDQVYRLLNDERVPTAEAMAGLSIEDRDVLSSLLDGLANFRGGIKKDNNLLVTRKIQPILQMADRLRNRADMEIVNANICRKVDAYGKYDAIQPAVVRAGVANKPYLYYEIENLNPRLDGNNNWVTTLQQDLVLYDEFGQPQWSKLGIRIKDECRNKRRDFFLRSELDFKPNLKAGRYMLKITLTEANARIAEQSVPINFEVNAPTNNLAPGPQGPVFGR